MNLEHLGWDDAFAAAFAPHAAAGLEPGRVALEHNHVYRVLTSRGERLAETAGRLKHRAEARSELPTVGDWVALPAAAGAVGSAGASGPASGQRSLIQAVVPRRSWFSRRAAGRETTEQVVAANVDTVLIVFGLDTPVKARAIERYLVLARRSRVAPVVVLNKSDLSTDLAADVAEAMAAAGAAAVVAVSAHDDAELSALRAHLAPGRTLAMLGPSGVGKSSIVNRLVGHELLPTGEVREWDARGRHTSVHRQMVVLESGGVIIDTPGMRELQLWDAGDEASLESFEDVAALAAACRFRDCRHEQEPGCAVKRAAETGELDAGRYGSFLKIQEERAAFDRLKDERARTEAKRQAKIGQRAYRARQKDKARDLRGSEGPRVRGSEGARVPGCEGPKVRRSNPRTVGP